MNVTLLDATSLTLAAKAAKLCIGKEWGGGDEAAYLKTLIQRGHESVLEHVVYVFEVQGLSRACLQQLARHRHISLSVKSTRWALKEHAAYYIPPEMLNEDRDEYVRRVEDMIEYGKRLGSKYGNDVGKYPLPECLQTDLILTLNLRELRHIYKLRTGRTAMLEFQHLAKALVACLPDDEQELVRYRSEVFGNGHGRDAGAVGEDGGVMQYRIESIKGWRNPAIIRVKDGVVIGYVYAEHADEIKPYLGQGVDVEE